MNLTALYELKEQLETAQSAGAADEGGFPAEEGD